MFVAALKGLLLDSYEEAPDIETRTRTTEEGFDPGQRKRFLDAARSGDEARVEQELNRLLARRDAALTTDRAVSRRQERQLTTVERFEAWTLRERAGRTEASRAEARALNCILQAWFSHVSIAVCAEMVLFDARLSDSPCAANARFSRREWTRYVPLPQRRHQLQRMWDEPAILDALRAWATEHGRTPRSMDWKHGGFEHPSSLTVRRAFKRWSTAVTRAGLKKQQLNWRARWSDDEILNALQLWARRHGRAPKREEWVRSGAHRPCRNTVSKRFGSWSAALEAADLQPDLNPARWPDAAIRAALQDWTRKHGRPPSRKEWVRAGPAHPCHTTVYRRFGTWGAALSAAGVRMV
jgi:hypothetical protein